MGLLGIRRTRAGETRQGRLRLFDEAIARFVEGNLNLPFFRGFYGAQAVGASVSHEISHMRRRYSALSVEVRFSVAVWTGCLSSGKIRSL